MPYIPQDDRLELEAEWPRPPLTSGELNYKITRMVQQYLKDTCGAEEPRYDDYNTVIGVLEACKHEMYRRVIAQYEDKKESENGPVW